MRKHSRAQIQIVVLAVAAAFMLIMSTQLAQAQTFNEIDNSNPLTVPDRASHSRLLAAYGKVPLAFEANQGQTDSRVKFLARGTGYTMFLTGGEAALEFRQTVGEKQKAEGPDAARRQVMKTGRLALGTSHSREEVASVVRMKLIGASPAAQATALDELPGKTNYFIGNDPKKWRTDVPNYAKVEYQSVYPGIDLVYYGNHQQLEYDFIVAPGAQPSKIKLAISAVANAEATAVAAGSSRSPAILKDAHPAPLRIEADGDLVVQVAGSEIRFHKPVVYQDVAGSAGNSPTQNRKYLDGSYVLTANDQVRFHVGAYDKTKSLIIDPLLTYSSLIGGSYIDDGLAITVDASGNAYLTGVSNSPNFPIVNQIPGACNGNCPNGGNGVVYLTKINAAGSALVFSSFIGGSGGGAGSDDGGYGIAIDSSGNVYLAGVASSPDFPRVNQIPAACNGSCNDGYHTAAFVAKINAAGNALVYCSLLGGSGGSGGSDGDGAYGIGVDRSGNAYVAGFTSSPDFPLVFQIFGACNGTCGTGTGFGFEDDYDTFVTKVNATGTALVYSTYVGGSHEDLAWGIAVDSSGNAYLAGDTQSTDFPRVNQIPGACNGGCGNGTVYVAYLAKINAAGTAITYSSLIGGTGGSFGDQARAIAVDSSDSAILTGVTSSPDFPIVNQIPGACNGSCGNYSGQNQSDVYVLKVNPAGSALAYSTLLGGSGYEVGYSIAVDTSGNAYLTGETNSSIDFPRVNPVPGACPGAGYGCGIFVTEVNAAGSALVYSSYLGGSAGDFFDIGLGIAADSSGAAYVTGWAGSSDFPRVNQIPGACNGSCNQLYDPAVFAVKISGSGGPAVSLSPTSLNFGPQGMQVPNTPQVVTLTNTGSAGLLISSIAITGTDQSSFSQWNDCPISPNPLAPGDHCAITVVFSPQQAGTLNAAVTVTDNAPGSPENVPLTGIGVSGKPGPKGPQD